MSADNYAICPRCFAEGKVKVGAIYVEPEDYRTFREDYEFWGTDTGTVTAHYRGECDVCHLSCRFDYPATFYTPAPTTSNGEGL